jgi:hypothetical protein
LAVAIDDGEAALQGDVMVVQFAQCSGLRVAAGRRQRGKADGDGLRFGMRVVGSVLRYVGDESVGLVAHLRTGLREPTLDGAIHQQVAKQEHEDEWDERNQDCSPQHAGAQTRAQDTGAPVSIEFEDIADEKNEDSDEEEERYRRERDKDQGLLG